MPLYNYECDCGERFDEFVPYDRRNEVKCGKCSRLATKLLSTESKPVVFEPMWYHDIAERPIFVESKRQLKEECKKRGLVAARLL